VKPFRTYNAEEKALLASGFLTNLSVTLINASARFGTNSNAAPPMAEVSRRLHAAVIDNDWLPFSLQMDFQSNRVSVEIICRRKDVPLLTRALESY
jgi:hypothetical protein